MYSEIPRTTTKTYGFDAFYMIGTVLKIMKVRAFRKHENEACVAANGGLCSGSCCKSSRLPIWGALGPQSPQAIRSVSLNPAVWWQSRKRQQAEEYFNVTAVRLAAGPADRCTSFAFPTSHNGRHSLTVRRGDWVVTNIHAESGPRSVERDVRSQQLRHLSRGHEHSADKMHLLVGDFNARPGEDQCLLSEGWRDVWVASPEIDDWTWRAGANRARYDRVYLHNSNAARARCTVIERLPNVWGLMTDHVALHAVVRCVPRASSVPGFCAAPDGPVAEALTVEAGVAASHGAEDALCQQSSASGQAEEFSVSSQPRSDTPVASIATKVETEILGFREMAQLWEEDPVMRGDVEEQSLTAWKEIPVACGFRVVRPQEDGAQRRATPADKLAQQQKYAKCKAWASQCGLTDDEFHLNLHAVPTDKHQRGGAQLPAFLRSWDCSAWEHARLLCVKTSIRTVAANAGRRLGGEALASQAAEEVSELLSSEAYRLSRLLTIPQRWRGDMALRLPADSHSLGSGIASLPGFFEMWLRDQAAALMGRRAEENWRTLVRQEAQSLCPEPEGLSQRRAASQQQPRAGEIAPSHFVLDGATCKKGAGRNPMATAWHGFLWRSWCDEVRCVANNGGVWCLGIPKQNIHVVLLLFTCWPASIYLTLGQNNYLMLGQKSYIIQCHVAPAVLFQSFRFPHRHLVNVYPSLLACLIPEGLTSVSPPPSPYLPPSLRLSPLPPLTRGSSTTGFSILFPSRDTKRFHSWTHAGAGTLWGRASNTSGVRERELFDGGVVRPSFPRSGAQGRSGAVAAQEHSPPRRLT